MDKEEIKRRILEEPKPLSSDQEKAVLSESKYIKIVAGAGAGKTETLARRIAYLLLYKDVSPAEIVAFTFTEKAAQNMKSRLYQRISSLGREDILKRIGEMYVGTIHAFCMRILEDYYGYGNYKVFDENQEMAFLLRFGWSLGLGKKGAYSKNCEDFLNTLNVVYNEPLDREILKKDTREFYKMLGKYENELEDHHRLTFNLMSYLAVEKLKENPEKLKHIKYLIVDEFQDINNLQFTLIQTIGSNANVFVVGDPRQSIYQWRGSNERFFVDFISHFPEAGTVEIKENRRSTKEIVDASNHFADQFDEEEYEHLESTRGNGGRVLKLTFSDDREEANWAVAEIERLVNGGKCRYSDFGILLRSVDTSGGAFVEELKKRKIPYLVGGKIGLFKRDETQAIGCLLSWVSDRGFWVENPYNWSEKIEGDDLLECGIDSWSNAMRFTIPPKIGEELRKWKERILNSEYPNFKEVYHDLLCILGYHKLDSKNSLDAACMANLGRLSSLIGDYEVSIRLGGGKHRGESDMIGLCWFMNSYATKSYEEQPIDDIRQTDAVQILTVHQAKGLEWPVVIIPALVERRFPSKKAGQERRWLIPRTIFDARRYEGGLGEEKRLFYVAMTRAKDQLFFSYFENREQSIFLKLMDSIPLETKKGTDYSIDYSTLVETEVSEIQTFSATEIIEYMKCPHHYRLNKMWGYAQQINPLIGYGDALHFCLRHAAELVKRDGYSPISAVTTAVDQEFHLPFASESLTEKIRGSAKTALVKFAKKNERDMRNIEEVETRIEFPLQNATITGKVDVILRDKDAYEIRDYKTSDQVITDEDSNLQIRLYTTGLRETGRKIDYGSIAYIKEPEKTDGEFAHIRDVTINPPELEKARKTAEETIEQMRKGCFDARKSDFCDKCEYSKICNRG